MWCVKVSNDEQSFSLGHVYGGAQELVKRVSCLRRTVYIEDERAAMALLLARQDFDEGVLDVFDAG